MSSEKISPRDKIVDNLIETIEKNPAVWQKTWTALASQRPHNPLSGTIYRGVNMVNLAIMGNFMNNDPRWATFNQAKAVGFPVMKGSKSIASAIFHKVTTELKTPDGITHKINGDSNELKLQKAKEIIKATDSQLYSKIENIKYLSVLGTTLDNTSKYELNNKVLVTSTPLFNYSQLENAPKLEVKEAPAKTWEDLERADNLLKATKYDILHDRLNDNYYDPTTKEIHLVSKSAFSSPEAYYSTALHECAHAKMDDKTIPLKFNPDDYSIDKSARAKEELRAEMSSIFICAELGINYDVQNHASYLNSWLKVLKEDKNELWNAASDSNKIADAIISLEKEQVLEKTAEVQQPQNNSLTHYVVAIAGAEYSVPDGSTIGEKIVTNLEKQGYTGTILEPKTYDNKGIQINNPSQENKAAYLAEIKERINANGFETLSKNEVQVFFDSKYPSEKTQYAGNDSELMWRIRHNPNDALDIVKNEVKPETINNRNNYSETALEILVRQENTEAAKLLIDKGANVDLLYLRDDVNGNDKNGFYTISHIAALDKNSELLDYLETAGADQSMKDNEGNTAKDVLEATIYHGLEKDNDKPNDMDHDLFS